MSANPEAGTPPITLPFEADRLAAALDNGLRWYTSAEEPLIQANCEAVSIAIKTCLEQCGVSVDLMVTEERRPSGRLGMFHVVSQADLANGHHTIDGNHGQFLSETVGHKLDRVQALTGGQFKRSQARCVIFPSMEYEAAIQDTMSKIFGDEADEALMTRAQEVYGKWWKPFNFRPYEPTAADQEIADLILPPMQAVLGLN